MIPWKLDHFQKVLFGLGTSDISRIHGLFQYGATRSPSFETIQKLFDPRVKVRRSTFEKCISKETGKGLGAVYDFYTSESFIGLIEGFDGRLSSLIEIFLRIIRNPEEYYAQEEQTEFLNYLLSAFPHLFSAALYIERIVYDDEKMILRDLPAKLPNGEFRLIVKNWPNEQKALAFEFHVFLLYFACIELDLETWDASFEKLTPTELIPHTRNGRVAFPMHSFWSWVREQCQCKTWLELADQLQTSEQSIKRAANTKTLIGAPSWNDFWRMMKNAENGPDFIVQASVAYGIARLMQEHTSRCIEMACKHFCDSQQIHYYYQDVIAQLKENECRSIPLHSCFIIDEAQ